jgi:Concanavalin A-like lectin/glucanases superfamily
VRACVLVIGLAAVIGCGPPAAFGCRQSIDCAGLEGGVCEPQGWCSFPDAACEVGRRYGHWVGDGLADRCVPGGIADTGGSTTTDVLTTLATTAIAESSSDPSTSLPVTDTGSEGGASSVGDSSEVTTGGPAEGPIAWYRFEEGEFAGTVLDSVGEHHGVCDPEHCPASQRGVVGNAAAFDGIDDVVRVADHLDFHTEGAFTLSAWVSVTTPPLDFRSIVGKGLAADSYYDSWELGQQEDGRLIATMAITADATIDAIAPDPLLARGWVHLAARWDGSTLLLFVDGIEQASAAADTVVFTDAEMFIGASWDLGTNTNFLPGAIDELQIWRRALDDDEIVALGQP